MRYIFLLIAIMLFLDTNAQEKRIYGRVTDQNKAGIPFCVVQAKGRTEGVYCDENGVFSITVNTDSVKAFTFYCLGYEKKEIAVDQLKDSAIVQLQQAYTNLRTVVFVAPKGRVRRGVLGRRRLRHISDCYGQYGDENTVFLKADGRSAQLKDVFVYITNEGVPSTKFRIHVYEKDPLTNLPAKELTEHSIILHANAGDEWVSTDLSNEMIPLNGGVFISVEWIAGQGNSGAALQSAKHEAVTAYNGQVLGLALNYGVSYMYHRSGFHTEWTSIDKQYLCPMIYGTYTYRR